MRGAPKTPTKPSAVTMVIHLSEADLKALDDIVEDQRRHQALSPSRSKLTRVALRLLGEIKPLQLAELLNASK